MLGGLEKAWNHNWNLYRSHRVWTVIRLFPYNFFFQILTSVWILYIIGEFSRTDKVSTNKKKIDKILPTNLKWIVSFHSNRKLNISTCLSIFFSDQLNHTEILGIRHVLLSLKLIKIESGPNEYYRPKFSLLFGIGSKNTRTDWIFFWREHISFNLYLQPPSLGVS